MKSLVLGRRLEAAAPVRCKWRSLRLSKPLQLRADAARNRERLIVAAQDRFASGDKAVSLESVAQAAGTGIATLYRHFPTREALVEAVYHLELDALTAEAAQLLGAYPAFDALRLWMDRYARFVATKHAMQEALHVALTLRASAASDTRAQIREAVSGFLAKGAADGTIRHDVEPDDVTISLAGLVLMTVAASDPAQLRRVLNLLMDGLRPHR